MSLFGYQKGLIDNYKACILRIDIKKYYKLGEMVMNEREKMEQGLWYDANNDTYLIEQRSKAKDLCFDLNQTRPGEKEKRVGLIVELLGYQPNNLELISPFMCDYGNNIKLGENVFINSNCYFMDCGKVTIGDNVFIGPSCGLYTANHPLDFQTRNQGLEQALPITIGNNVWLGGNVVILPGITIGDNCVIGAGSVVTKDVGANSIACGNPCKVIKEIN